MKRRKRLLSLLLVFVLLVTQTSCELLDDILNGSGGGGPGHHIKPLPSEQKGPASVKPSPSKSGKITTPETKIRTEDVTMKLDPSSSQDEVPISTVPDKDGVPAHKIIDPFEDPSIPPGELVLPKTPPVVRIDVHEGTESPGRVTVRYASPKKLLRGTKMLCYDVQPEKKKVLDGYLSLRLSYLPLEEMGKIQQGSIGVAYFNPKTESWERVPFRIDKEKKEVSILTNHFSIYSCFYIADPGKRWEVAAFACPYDALELMEGDEGLRAALGIVKESYFKYQGKPSPSALSYFLKEMDKNMSDTTNKMGFAGFIDDEIHAALQTSGDWKLTSKVNSILSKVGLVVSTAKLIEHLAYIGQQDRTFDLGEYEKAYTELALFFAQAGFNEAMNAVGGMFSMIYPIYQNTVLKFRTSILANEKKFYQKGYKIYYKKFEPRSAKDWAKIIQDIRKRIKTEREVSDEIDQQVHDYARLCWKDTEEKWQECLDDVDVSGLFGGWWRRGATTITSLTQEIQESVAKEHEEYILQAVIPVAAQIVRKADEDKMIAKVTQALNELMTVYNERYVLEFKDPEGKMVKGKPYAPLAGATVCLVGKDGKPNQTWSCRLNRYGQSRFTFTYLAWLKAGKPERVKVFARGQNPAKDAPILDFVPTFTGTKTRVLLRAFQGFPTVDEITQGMFYLDVISSEGGMHNLFSMGSRMALGVSRAPEEEFPEYPAGNNANYMHLLKTLNITKEEAVKQNIRGIIFRALDYKTNTALFITSLSGNLPYQHFGRYDPSTGLLSLSFDYNKPCLAGYEDQDLPDVKWKQNIHLQFFYTGRRVKDPYGVHNQVGVRGDFSFYIVDPLYGLTNGITGKVDSVLQYIKIPTSSGD